MRGYSYSIPALPAGRPSRFSRNTGGYFTESKRLKSHRFTTHRTNTPCKLILNIPHLVFMNFYDSLCYSGYLIDSHKYTIQFQAVIRIS